MVSVVMLGYLDELDNIFISRSLLLEDSQAQWERSLISNEIKALSQVCLYQLYEPGKTV